MRAMLACCAVMRVSVSTTCEVTSEAERVSFCTEPPVPSWSMTLSNAVEGTRSVTVDCVSPCESGAVPDCEFSFPTKPPLLAARVSAFAVALATSFVRTVSVAV